MELNETRVKEALIESRGDMIQASQALDIRPSKLGMFIRSVPSVAALWMEMEAVKATPEYETASQQWFENAIRARLAAYRFEGLEVIHELATTPHGENAAMADVRLKAAIQLRGASDGTASDAGGVLAELNQIYHANAPRIKSMRVTQAQIEFEPAK